MRYTVGYCLYPHGQNDTTETRMRIIFDDGLPATELNRHLVMAQFNRDKPLGTTVYQLCIYLNYLDMHGLEAVDATMDMIYDFLCELYVDGLPYGCNNEPKSYNTICDYVETLSKLYDTLALRGYHLDSSLYTQTQKMMLLPDPKTKRRKGRVIKKGEHLTSVYLLVKMFSPNQNDIPKLTYTKWYSAEQIRAIADALPLTYRCIFLDTVYTGHRIDSALSLTLDTVDLYNAQVTPTRTKTGKRHTSLIPHPLVEDFQSYLMDVRSKIDTDSEYFYVGHNGSPVTYNAYRSALESARMKVNKTFGWNIEALHTHAGRSTFAAAIRSYQLEQQRKGIPTFSDVDFCNLMDWKSLDSLKHYDLVNRVQDVEPILIDFYKKYKIISSENSSTANGI